MKYIRLLPHSSPTSKKFQNTKNIYNLKLKEYIMITTKYFYITINSFSFFIDKISYFFNFCFKNNITYYSFLNLIN